MPAELAPTRREEHHAPHARKASWPPARSPPTGPGAPNCKQRGLPVGACPDAWNLSQPERVEEVARAYVEAGSQVILTNTFGANRFILARHGLADQVAAVNRGGGGHFPPRRPPAGPLVFASIGPSGVMLHDGRGQPKTNFGRPSPSRPQALAEAGADGIVVETMSDPAEAVLAVAAARDTGLPVVACMTFDSGAKQDRTMMGTTPEQAAEQLLAAGADCVGSNCGQGIDGFVDICRRLHAATGRPVWIKANAGLPEMQRRPGHLQPDGRRSSPPRARACRSRGRHDRRLLRHHARVHRRRPPTVERKLCRARGLGEASRFRGDGLSKWQLRAVGTARFCHTWRSGAKG